MDTTEESVPRFGEVIRSIRMERHKSLQQLADQLGVSVSYLSDVERGRRGVLSLEAIRIIADFLQADPVTLVMAAISTTNLASIRLPEDAHHEFQQALARMTTWEADRFYDPFTARTILDAVQKVETREQTRMDEQADGTGHTV